MIRRRLTSDEVASAAGTLDAGKTLTDVVGTVRSIGPAHVDVDTRRGEVHIALSDVVTAKALGPRPTRRGAPHRAVSVSDLEELMVGGWAPLERAPLGRWMLRAAGGYTGRANSGLVLGDPGVPTTDALAAVRRWYDERSLSPLLQVPLAPGVVADDDPFVRDAVRDGWEAFGPVRVMTAASALVAQAGASLSRTAPSFSPSAPSVSQDSAHRPSPPDDTAAADQWIDVRADLTDAWWALAGERTLAHEDVARRVLTGSSDQRFLTVTGPETTTLAHARLALTPGWAGVFHLATRADARRQGLARRLLQIAAAKALSAQAPSMYLQVAVDNAPAISLYESVGFTTHHTYVYLRPVTG